MTGTSTARSHAPGKLFVAGEYAVMEPGHPAILVAVDRQVSVTVSGSDDADVVIDSDLRRDEARLHRKGGGLVAADAAAQDGLGHVLAAIAVIDELLAERGWRMPAVRVSIRSRLHRDGTKFGLGSSGAVTVATVTALASYCGVELSPDERYRLAMLATARRDADSSGGDLAASVWGGWLEYHAPDRAVVLEMVSRRGVTETLRTPWPGFGVRRLAPPRGLALEVGWTGQPASTFSLAQRLGAQDWRGSAAQRGFVARSDECVRASIRALDRGDDRGLLDHIRTARRVLAELDDEVGLGIFTPRLTALCDAADAVGGAAKPSGAGGGDCGIALLDATARRDISQLRKEWVAAGVLPMPIHVPPRKGSKE